MRKDHLSTIQTEIQMEKGPELKPKDRLRFNPLCTLVPSMSESSDDNYVVMNSPNPETNEIYRIGIKTEDPQVEIFLTGMMKIRESSLNSKKDSSFKVKDQLFWRLPDEQRSLILSTISNLIYAGYLLLEES
jgi:hypothetical protein